MKKLSYVVVALACATCGGRVDGDAGAPDASSDVGSQTCTLSLSSYSTSCAADTDCVGVFIGNACTANCFCATGAIAASSQAVAEGLRRDEPRRERVQLPRDARHVLRRQVRDVRLRRRQVRGKTVEAGVLGFDVMLDSEDA